MKGLLINLPEETLSKLEKLGEKDGRSRKNYIEMVLKKHVKRKKI